MGGTTAWYDTAGRMSSGSIAPELEWQGRATDITVSAGFATFATGEASWLGHGDFSQIFAPAGAASRFRAEVAGSIDGNSYSGGSRALTARGELRMHVAAPSAGFWVGGTAAAGGTSTSTGRASVGPTVGVWGRRQVWNFMAVLNPYRLEGYWITETQGRAATSIGLVDVMGYVGWRGAPGAAGIPNTAWAGGTCTARVTPQAALVFAAGTYPSDLLQAVPHGRYLSAGIRLSRYRPLAWVPSSTGHALYARTRGVGELRFAVPGASRVDLVGDWTAWKPVPLRRASDGRWILRTNLASGVHRFNLVVDGDRWFVPEGSPAVDDGFGGKTSLLVVP